MRSGQSWFKSSYSDGEGAACVEAAAVPGAIRIRDSKRKGGAQLAIPAPSWAPFLVYAAGYAP
ncbi:DUF397 domain-containing protein [Streptomyces sp. NPDC052396]|uniref:DUF397 domain-containing protein n=1 Tax=Streptomyces sp. NPDC052396 TaxID=3365689 RepID=UPI0037D89BCF